MIDYVSDRKGSTPNCVFDVERPLAVGSTETKYATGEVRALNDFRIDPSIEWDLREIG